MGQGAEHSAVGYPLHLFSGSRRQSRRFVYGREEVAGVALRNSYRLHHVQGRAHPIEFSSNFGKAVHIAFEVFGEASEEGSFVLVLEEIELGDDVIALLAGANHLEEASIAGEF